MHTSAPSYPSRPDNASIREIYIIHEFSYIIGLI
nr:MAG TPA: hypothetical protein [Caudoviricetes sp.]DAX04604.1 MAG TPA: hypothetical protein [Bacteriophage sp.]